MDVNKKVEMNKKHEITLSIIFFSLLVLLIPLFTACSKQPETNPAIISEADPVESDFSKGFEDDSIQQIKLPAEELDQRLEIGSGWSLWSSPEGMSDGIPSMLIQYLGEEEFQSWVGQFSHQIPINPDKMPSLYLVAHTFHLTEEDFDAVNELRNKQYHETNPGAKDVRCFWTKEEIDLIVGDDYAAYYAHFGNPAAVLTDTSICPPKWLYTHFAEDYVQEGITAELLERRLPEIETALGDYIDQNYTEEYTSAGKELKEAFHIKLSENLAALKAMLVEQAET